MAGKKDRIILDTNVWVSFLLTKDYSRLDKILSDRAPVLLFSRELLEEFMAVARRSKFKKYFTLVDLQDLIEQIRLNAEFIEVSSNVDICRDPKDNFLLSLSKDGGASHLITGDKDLLDLGKFGKTRIINITTYLKEK